MIHRYQLNGYNIVLDVCSGSIHAVDGLTYDMIGLFEDGGREAVVAAARALHPEAADAELELPEVLPVEEAIDLFLTVLESKVISK